jgi:hypothetical protein
MSNEQPTEHRKFVCPPCDLCSAVSVVMIRAPQGCTCLRNVYQRRCAQHLQRAWDTMEEFEIVEDYTIEKVFSSNGLTQPQHRDEPAQHKLTTEKLRITIKMLERQDRANELETARFFLRELKRGTET